MAGSSGVSNNGAMVRPSGGAPARGSQSLEDFIQENLGALQQVATRQVDVSRLVKLVVNAVAQNENLRKCSIQSVFRCLQQAAEIGLEPNTPLGHAYLVPYGNVCQYMIGYRGFIQLARRSGEIAGINCCAVFDGDRFEVELGSEPRITHVPNFAGRRRDEDLMFVYAIAITKDGEKSMDIMTKWECDKIRARSRASGAGPWVTDYVEMCRKTVVRRASKYWPMSIEMAAAVSVDEETEFGPIDVLSSTTIAPESHQIVSQAAIGAAKPPTAAELHQTFKAKATAMGYEGKVPELAGKLLGYLPAKWTAAVWQEALDKTETEWRAAILMLEPVQEPAAEPESSPEDDASPFDETADDSLDMQVEATPVPASVPGAFN